MAERTYDGPVLFRNGIGREMYQPTLSTGERLYFAYPNWADDRVKMWLHPGGEEQCQPVLYTWRKAARVSAREARRRVRADTSHWHEVTPVASESGEEADNG